MAKNFISEDQIEQALLKHLQSKYRFELLNCMTAAPDTLSDGSNRKDKRDVILQDRLLAACQQLNPEIPLAVLEEQVIPLVTDRRTAQSLIAANREMDKLIRDGVTVNFDDEEGRPQQETVRLIDFDNAENNQYLAVTQLWIQAQTTAAKAAYRRPDVILYVNGLPLVFIELKNSNVKLRSAFDDNLANYKRDIPQLFHCNAFCMLSNAIDTRIGSFSAGWEHFFQWLRVDNEKEKLDRKKIAAEGTSLEYALAGLCNPTKLLDYIENFVLFYKDNSKIIAQNHQFIGVNNAFDRFLRRHEHDGKLGVFWHTQGSGKSFSMIFYARKIFRKVAGNFSFVVVTDREDLDNQIYRNFLFTQTIQENEAAQPKNSEQMRHFLSQNKKVVFTLIQKFRYEKGKRYPKLFDPEKDKREIIVMVDEAHRTQYKSLAENMRKGLKGANFLAFTGTPLLGRQRKTNAWFGEYVSEYNFQQAMEEQATVPLVYKKRVPEVLIQNEDLGKDFYELLENEDLDQAQKEKIERKYSQETEVIKRDERLETIAKDIVQHFPRRGYLGKAMVVSLDKFTAVKMYEKVQYHWKEELKRLQKVAKDSQSDIDKEKAKRIIEYMRTVEMAVVISDAAGDKERFKEAGLNSIDTHIQRMEALDQHSHDIEYNFKDPEHPLQIVFVCAMWLTGFDAPTVSTLYLDKPMKGHTLMQTIARANRVAAYQVKGLNGELVEKTNGEIVDYYNVFRNMKKALAQYGTGESGETPVIEKDLLFKQLDEAIALTASFCQGVAIDLQDAIEADGTFKSLGYFETFTDILLGSDNLRKSFYVYENTVSSLYEACKPEILEQPPRPLIAVIKYLRGMIEAKIESAPIEHVNKKISDLLDESIGVDKEASNDTVQHLKAQYQIVATGRTLDFSKIDFEKLQEEFKTTQYKNTEVADLRALIEAKLREMLENNSNRIHFAQRFQDIIERYNAGASSNENAFDEFVDLSKAMSEEEERAFKMGLTEDELELFDLLKKDKLTKDEEQNVKLAAKTLLTRLTATHPRLLVQDWWRDSQTQKIVKSAVEEVLDENLPDSYDRALFASKCNNVYQLAVDFAREGKKWAA